MKILRLGVRVLVFVIAMAYVLVLLLAVFSDHLIFQPHRPSYRLDSLVLPAFDKVQTFTINDGDGGTLAAAYLPNPEARYTILYSHGNGEDIGDDLPFLEEYWRAGFAVFAYDYNGYGQSSGKPTEAAIYRDSEAAYDFVTGSLHVVPEKVISFGHSLGAAAAIHLAGSRSVAGLIAQAPFISAFRVATQVPLVPWDKFNNARAIRKVKCPVLIAHGRRDGVIPFWHGKRIYSLANEPKQYVWLEKAGHNDVMQVDSLQFVTAVQNFAKHLEKRSD